MAANKKETRTRRPRGRCGVCGNRRTYAAGLYLYVDGRCVANSGICQECADERIEKWGAWK